MRAILLHLKTEDICWNITDFGKDEERKRYHEQKMVSKDTRPAAQLTALGLGADPGFVMHISHV